MTGHVAALTVVKMWSAMRRSSRKGVCGVISGTNSKIQPASGFCTTGTAPAGMVDNGGVCIVPPLVVNGACNPDTTPSPTAPSNEGCRSRQLYYRSADKQQLAMELSGQNGGLSPACSKPKSMYTLSVAKNRHRLRYNFNIQRSYQLRRSVFIFILYRYSSNSFCHNK